MSILLTSKLEETTLTSQGDKIFSNPWFWNDAIDYLCAVQTEILDYVGRVMAHSLIIKYCEGNISSKEFKFYSKWCNNGY